jgi:DNA-binding NarL/FixJ family response regulator
MKVGGKRVDGLDESWDSSTNGRSRTMTLHAPEPRVDTVLSGEPMPDLEKISVAIVDDHPVVLRGLEGLIDAEPDMTVVATARDGEEAIRRVIATHPDVVVMDIRMPTCDGVEATEQILAVHPEIRVILLSGELGPSVVTALRAGAYGYLSKETADRDLVGSIRDAADGRPVIASSVLGHLLDALRRTQDPSPLTPRDRAILACVAQGSTNEQIAHELGHSISTVKAHLAALYERVGASDRASALAVCFRRGWIT